MKKITLIVCLLILSCQGYASWKYDKSNGNIYTIYQTKDNSGWSVYVILAVSKNRISLSATVPFSEYKKIFTSSPPPVLTYKGFKLVKHDTFFWGKKGSPEKLKIDGKEFLDFNKNTQNSFQIVNNDGAYSNLIKAFKAGNSVVLDKHYWLAKKKRYPSFSLIGFTSAYKSLIGGSSLSKPRNRNFDPIGLRCKKNGRRKTVWINTSHGTYALNGQAIAWLKRSKETGSPLIGTDGKEWKMGRDYIEPSQLKSLIQQGLIRCK